MLLDGLFRGIAEKPLGALVPAQDSAVQVGSNDAIVRGFYDGCQECPHLFRMLAFRDVLRNPDKSSRVACLGRNRKHSRPDPPYVAIGPDNAIFNLRLAHRGGDLELVSYTIPIVRVDGFDPRGWVGVGAGARLSPDPLISMADEVRSQAIRIAPEEDFVDVLDDALGKLTKPVVAGNCQVPLTPRRRWVSSSAHKGQPSLDRPKASPSLGLLPGNLVFSGRRRHSKTEATETI